MISKQIALQLLNKGKAIKFNSASHEYIAIKKGNADFELFTYIDGAHEADVSIVSFEQLLNLWNEGNASRDFRVVEDF